MIILGIDPGKSGGYAVFADGKCVAVESFDPRAAISDLIRTKPDIAYLEQVHSMPAQGVHSVFTFGENFGWWQGVLQALEIPFERVTPQKWQKAMSCLSKGDKNVTKKRAAELFPKIKVTHAIADALLIAEYGRRKGGGTDGLFNEEGR